MCNIISRERNYVEHKKIKYYDDPKDNTAFERCIDVMSRLMLKYGKITRKTAITLA